MLHACYRDIVLDETSEEISKKHVDSHTSIVEDIIIIVPACALSFLKRNEYPNEFA